jgi:uncharacterized RDD family membrane protein YckC
MSVVGILIYHASLETYCGSTLGKMLFGIAVTDPQGKKISFFRSIIRCFIKIFSVLMFGLGIITTGIGYFTSSRKQGIHDYLTKTVVIHHSCVDLS